MQSDKADVLMVYPAAQARSDSSSGAGMARWTIHPSGDAAAASLGSGQTEDDAWSAAVRRLLEESATRR